jgi:hypothetical protein
VLPTVLPKRRLLVVVVLPENMRQVRNPVLISMRKESAQTPGTGACGNPQESSTTLRLPRPKAVGGGRWQTGRGRDRPDLLFKLSMFLVESGTRVSKLRILSGPRKWSIERGRIHRRFDRLGCL